MEDLWRISYPYELCSSSYYQSPACIPHYPGNVDTNEGIQIQTPTKSSKFMQPGTCLCDDALATVVFDALSTKRPHDYGMLGTASLGPVVQLDLTSADDSSPAVTQCWQKIVANVGAEGQTLNSNSRADSSLNSSNPNFHRPTGNNRWKTAAGGGGHDRMARESTENGHVHKVVERQRRSTMKTLCSTLISLLPEEYHKVRFSKS